MSKTTIISDKRINYEGLYDLKSAYSFLKSYLGDFKHYDVTEKEAEEINKGDIRELKGNFEAELEYNDYYKFIITFELKFAGKKVVTQRDGEYHDLVEGNANLYINAYIETDYLQKRPKGPIGEFLDKIYSKYIEDEQKKAIGDLAGDVSEFISRFKQNLNYTIK